MEDPEPKLHVSLNLGGRSVKEILGDNWIINDGGETTIIVNGTKLHDGATGATSNKADNGGYVTIRKDGVTVDRTDPDNWTISDRSESTIKDRDFSAADFVETDRYASIPKPPPEPPPEPSPEPSTRAVTRAATRAVTRAATRAVTRAATRAATRAGATRSRSRGRRLWLC